MSPPHIIWTLVLLFNTAHLGYHIGPPTPYFYLTEKSCLEARNLYLNDVKKAGWDLKCQSLIEH